MFSMDVHQPQDLNEGIEFDQHPTKCTCPHCGGEVITFVEHQVGLTSYGVGFVFFMLFGIYTACLLPVVWPVTKDVAHHCPRCLNVLATRSRIKCPTDTKAEVVTIQIGSCAMVLAKKYLMLLLLVLCGIGGFFYLRQQGPISKAEMDLLPPGALVTDGGFQAYQADCGQRSALGNPLHATAVFDKKYKHKNVLWNARVVAVKEPIELFVWRSAAMLLMKGFADELPKANETILTHVVDVIGLFREGIFDEVSDVVPGDFIKLNATVLAMGRRGSPHVVKIWHVTKLALPAA